MFFNFIKFLYNLFLNLLKLTCANSLIDDAEKSVFKIDDFGDKRMIIEKKKEEEKMFNNKIKNKEKKSTSNKKNNITSLYPKENKNLMKVFGSTSNNAIAIGYNTNNSIGHQNAHSKERYVLSKRKNNNFNNTANGFKSPQHVNSSKLENPFVCDKKVNFKFINYNNENSKLIIKIIKSRN